MRRTPLIHPLPSPVHKNRIGKQKPHIIVIHSTFMDTAYDALIQLSNPSAHVSAHYLISGGGDIFQLVPEDCRAYHAGRQSFWKGCTSLNSRSIGIELAIQPCFSFPQSQLESLYQLCASICTRWHIEDIIGHEDIAPLRKEDPGILFPWEEMAREGFGFWPKTLPPAGSFSPASLQWALVRLGYGLFPDIDWTVESKAVWRSFLRHFWQLFPWISSFDQEDILFHPDTLVWGARILKGLGKTRELS